MKTLQFNGSHYEIGLQMGEILKGSSRYPPTYSDEVLARSYDYRPVLETYTPDLLDEFRGIADSLEIDESIPITLEATPFRFQTSSCFVMAISGGHTSSGSPVLARNHEWMAREAANLRVCYTQPVGKLSSIGFTFHWPLVSRYGGMNEAGLAFSFASASFETFGPGIILNLAARWILDTCETTEQAVAFLEEIPKVWGETYLLVDRKNTIARVESHARFTKVTYADQGFDAISLLYSSGEMDPYQDSERVTDLSELVSTRMDFVAPWFLEHRGTITDSDILAVLDDHDHRMCYHDREGLEICWSYLLDIGENQAQVCAGPPCVNEYISMDGP